MDYLISRFEGGGLCSQPTLRDLTSSFSVRATLQWMDLLLAALDCYNTFINLHIIKPHHMLSKPEFHFLKVQSVSLVRMAIMKLFLHCVSCVVNLHFFFFISRFQR